MVIGFAQAMFTFSLTPCKGNSKRDCFCYLLGMVRSRLNFSGTLLQGVFMCATMGFDYCPSKFVCCSFVFF